MVRKIPVVWIVGSSTVRRLRAHIEEQNQDVNLGLRCSVSWLGRDGRRWEELVPFLQEMSYVSQVEPDVIVIHLGANSMGFGGSGRRSLMKRMKHDTRTVMRLFPNCSLMFSDILPRRCWRYQRAVSGYGMERTRRWLNGVMRGFMADLGMNTTMHPGITLEHLADDGVNLNAEGNDILLQDIRSSLAKVSKLNVQVCSPQRLFFRASKHN